jgi:hypothetical protein
LHSYIKQFIEGSVGDLLFGSQLNEECPIRYQSLMEKLLNCSQKMPLDIDKALYSQVIGSVTIPAIRLVERHRTDIALHSSKQGLKPALALSALFMACRAPISALGRYKLERGLQSTISTHIGTRIDNKTSLQTNLRTKKKY